MSQNQNEADASAETQVLPAIPAPAAAPERERVRPRIHVPSAFLAPEASPDFTLPETEPGAVPDGEPKPAGRRRRVPASEVPAPIPVPAEFFTTPTPAAESAETAPPRAKPAGAATVAAEAEAGTEAVAAEAPASPAAAGKTTSTEAEPDETAADEKAAKKKDDGFSGPPRWQENVPFDETGVLMRPESLRAKAMQDETELISAIKFSDEDDGSEAAQAQRPGFWTGAWPRRGSVAAILALQAILSLRNNNTAFEDEALYLYSGHLELGHLLYGTSTGTDFWSYFSGAPVLYPVLGAIADQVGGLFAARLLSLLFVLGTTGLLYLLTRRLFGTRSAVCAAALYCCTEPVVFVGNLATYDAPALFLIALSAWLVVRFARSTWPWYLLAAAPMALAVATKYAALMFVPAVVVLSFLASVPRFGRWSLVRPVALTAGLGMILYAALKIAGSVALTGVKVTTTNRAQGTDTITTVLKLSGEWGGCLFAISLAGAVFVALPRRTPQLAALPAPRWQRILLILTLCGTALMVPAYQAHLHTTVALQKHVGFALFFVAPLAGYGLVRIVGPHFHRAQLGIGAVVLTFALGMGQSLNLFHVWPNSNALIAEIVKYQKPKAAYLVGADEVAIYALRGDPDAQPLQFTNTFFFAYTTAKGQYLTGPAAYTAAIDSGYFQVIAYTGNDDPTNETAIAAALYRSTTYRLVAAIPEATSYGTSHYYVWVRKQ